MNSAPSLSPAGGYVFSLLWARERSADFQSAVSPNCIRQGVGSSHTSTFPNASQSATLRYSTALRSRNQRSAGLRPTGALQAAQRFDTSSASVAFNVLRLTEPRSARSSPPATIWTDTDRGAFLRDKSRAPGQFLVAGSIHTHAPGLPLTIQSAESAIVGARTFCGSAASPLSGTLSETLSDHGSLAPALAPPLGRLALAANMLKQSSFSRERMAGFGV
jgi:hypothetical protein